MKVFISWSGETSKAIATALFDWIPNVIQSVKPWISSESIDKGERWNPNLAAELESTKVGIICVTPDNLTAPWLLFEAGALSKTIDNTKVCPVLFKINTSDLTGPLSQFQLTLLEKKEIQKLMSTINKSIGESNLNEKTLDDSFEKWWPDLEEKISSIPENKVATNKVKRSTEDIVSEILDLVRKIDRDMPDSSVLPYSMRKLTSSSAPTERISRTYEKIFPEIHNFLEERDTPVSRGILFELVSDFCQRDHLSIEETQILFKIVLNSLRLNDYVFA